MARPPSPRACCSACCSTVTASARPARARSSGRPTTRSPSASSPPTSIPTTTPSPSFAAAEDALYGRGRRGAELPRELAFKQSRLKKIQEAKAALVAAAQIIVAAEVTQESNDKKQVAPMIEALKENLAGQTPQVLSADNGYFSEENIKVLAEEKIDAHVATGRLAHGEAVPPAPRGRIAQGATVKERMARKLRTIKGRATYARRKEIVEPVFGQIKEARGIRRFLLRGVEQVRAAWKLICATHNLLKLWRRGGVPARG